MSFTKLPLGEAVVITRTGSTPSTSHPEFFNGSIPWFTPGDIGNTRDLVKSTRYITEEGLKSGKAKLFDKEMLLVTCIGDIGRVGVVQQPSSSNQQITALKFKNEIDIYYAYYWFIAHKIKLEQLANQAIIPILNNERLEEVEFFYPPLPEQHHITDLLSRADRLRRLRRVGDELRDSLLQSVFLEMFGNEKSNEFEDLLLEEIIVDCQSGFASGERSDSGVTQLRMNNVTTNGQLDWSSFIRVPATSKQIEKYQLRQGDILFNSTNSPELVGKSTLFKDKDEPVVFSNHFLRLRVDETKIHPIYLAQWLVIQWQERVFESLCTQWVNQAAVRKEDLLSLRLPVPPLPEQEEFAAVVQRVESLRARAGESARQGEELFQSLLSGAFKQ